MFSSGTQYCGWLDKWCHNCKKYTPWQEATKENQECPIEQKLALYSITGEEWPEQLKLTKEDKNGVEVRSIICNEFTRIIESEEN